jgi:hypothetical protein
MCHRSTSPKVYAEHYAARAAACTGYHTSRTKPHICAICAIMRALPKIFTSVVKTKVMSLYGIREIFNREYNDVYMSPYFNTTTQNYYEASCLGSFNPKLKKP